MRIQLNLIAHKEKDDITGLIWKEDEIWTSGKTLMKKMKEFM